jgi:hypothetical protein
VRLIYFDEAGIGHLKDEPLTVVCAVIVDADGRWLQIEKDVDKIIKQFVPPDEWESFEFHAKALFSRDKTLAKGKWTRANREAALRAFLELIPAHELFVASSAVNREGFRAHKIGASGTLKEQDFAFMMCLKAINTWFTLAAPEEVGICIADNSDRWRMMKDSLRHYRRHVGESPDLQITNLIDSVYFGDSHLSLGLQLADACSFFCKRYLMGRKDSEEFYRIFSSRIMPHQIHFND